MTRDQLRTKYELKVLRETLFRGARTNAEVRALAVRYLYTRVLAERVSNTSTASRE